MSTLGAAKRPPQLWAANLVACLASMRQAAYLHPVPAGPAILVVDDDSVDQMLVRRAFKAAGVKNPLFTATDGERGLALLRGGSNGAAVPKPRLVLLDLNMPRMNGHEFLENIRQDADLSNTTVFVLTTSGDTRDVQQAYERQVAGYITKEDAGPRYEGLLELLRSYLNIVALPT